MDVSAIVSINFDTLAYDFSNQLSYEEMIDFISTLDLHVGDWDFTEMIYEWAREQHKEFLAEKEEREREARYL